MVVSDEDHKMTLIVRTTMMKIDINFHKMINYYVDVMTVIRSYENICRSRIRRKPVGRDGLNISVNEKKFTIIPM